MFNTYENHTHNHSSYKKVDVHEHRAPTDESIRIYEEIKEKAYNSILQSIKIENNEFKCNAIVYKDYCSDKTSIKYLFLLNNKKYEGSIDVNIFDAKDKFKIVSKLYEQLSENISGELLKTIDIKDLI